MNGNRITGLANARFASDAVNYGQLEKAKEDLAGGVASSVAMANIPDVGSDKTFAIGVGVGSYDSEGAFAVGASYRVSPSTVVRGSVGSSDGGETSGGLGVSVSW